MKKKISLLLGMLMLLAPIFNLGVYADEAEVEDYSQDISLNDVNNEVDLFLYGECLISEDQPFIYHDRTYIPLRVIAEEMGFKVNYDDETRDIVIEDDDRKLEMNVHSKNYKVDGQDYSMDVAPIIVDDRTRVPVRFVAEAFDEEVIWDEDNRVVLIGEFEPNDDIEYDETLEFEDLGFYIFVDDEFVENIEVRHDEENNRYEFFTKANNEFIGTLDRTPNPITNAIPGVLLKYENGYYTELSFASDVQYSPETEENYLACTEMLKEAVYDSRFEDEVYDVESIYVKDVDLDAKTITIDPVEYLTLEDEERLEELNVDPNSLDNGYYVYNEVEEDLVIKFDEETIFKIKDKEDISGKGIKVEAKDFAENYKKDPTIYELAYEDDLAIEIAEFYTP